MKIAKLRIGIISSRLCWLKTLILVVFFLPAAFVVSFIDCAVAGASRPDEANRLVAAVAHAPWTVHRLSFLQGRLASEHMGALIKRSGA